MLFIITVTATIGWGGAAATAALANARMHPATNRSSAPLTPTRQPTETLLAPIAVLEAAGQTVPGRSWLRTTRLALLYAVIAAALILSAAGWLRG
jgi:hypothetical protein